MSDITPDGNGGFDLPDGGRLTPDGSGGFNILPSGDGLGAGELGLIYFFLIIWISLGVIVAVPTAAITILAAKLIKEPGYKNALGWSIIIGLVAVIVLLAIGDFWMFSIGVPTAIVTAYKLWPKK